MDLGTRLKNLRENQNLSQQQLTAKLGMNRELIANMKSTDVYPILKHFKKLQTSLGSLLTTSVGEQPIHRLYSMKFPHSHITIV
ncbi:ribosome-binding protein aMBF1 (putative translation factor) [Croceifilum oryzae]|uniref:Ribosome-binding protein aMBF1 (Putative translation factor) n=1 Tax=Croceifilum oryzae TaxID=1553429 RepID=A0AAJ1TPZ5_9BACL|nr:ribosome-binding protein aMBF1 (putative translation factor) [Croceifilum oryzae]